MGVRKEFGLSYLRNMRTNAYGGYNPFDFSSAGRFWGFSGGTIAFDYGAKTYRFGIGLDESEARHIVAKVKEQFKIPESDSLI